MFYFQKKLAWNTQCYEQIPISNFILEDCRKTLTDKKKNSILQRRLMLIINFQQFFFFVMSNQKGENRLRG